MAKLCHPEQCGRLIAHELRDAIVGGRYAAGPAPPPERRLATHYNASRATIREALRQLTDQQLVERRIGSGTFVTYRQAVEEHERSPRRPARCS